MEDQQKSLFQQRVEERLEAVGKKAAPLSVELGKSDSFIRDIMRRQTTPIGDNLLLLAKGLATTADYLLGRTDDPSPNAQRRRPTTKIVGRAGASTEGRIEFVDADGGIGEVEIPEGATEDSVAIEIEGYSQGFIADGCLIFYTEVHMAPTDDMLGTIVVVGTDDGEVLLKRLLRGSKPGLFDLESINGPMLKDRRVIWAAHVDSLVPPWRAKRLRVDASEIKL
ncbi:hypothetical protein [Devosia sp. FJ2-5-3]|uniref:hypothetical protein n=1 Tax=Devosia sp. FJ2-5-3 TaxID=2976680 RepID=UPI0023D805CC|nr:hypothetical protein [Devosia sp. FJ2-5-3]WEJ60200.1 hypothetical protein N0P34_09260 [Devosia sp. FJ2-5-3]